MFSLIGLSMDKKAISHKKRHANALLIIGDIQTTLVRQKSKAALYLQLRTTYQQLISTKILLGGSLTPLPNAQLQFTVQKSITVRDISLTSLLNILHNCMMFYLWLSVVLICWWLLHRCSCSRQHLLHWYLYTCIWQRKRYNWLTIHLWSNDRGAASL